MLYVRRSILRSFSVCLLALLLWVPPAFAAETPACACGPSFKKLVGKTIASASLWNHAWNLQLRFLDPEASPYERARSAVFNLTNLATGIALPAVMGAWNLWAIPIDIFRPNRYRLLSEHDLSWFGRLKLATFRLAARVLPAGLAYVIAQAAGLNAPMAIVGQGTFVDDLDDALKKLKPRGQPENGKPQLTLSENEFVVFIRGTGEPVSEPFLDHVESLYPSKKVLLIEGKTVPEVLRKIGKLPSGIHIKEFFWHSHGLPGSLTLSPGSSDPAATLSAASLRQHQDLISHWRKDLISENARMTFYSCLLGAGASGDELAAEVGPRFLPNGGKLVMGTEVLFSGSDTTDRSVVIPRMRENMRLLNGDGGKLLNSHQFANVAAPLVVFSKVFNGINGEGKIKAFDFKPSPK